MTFTVGIKTMVRSVAPSDHNMVVMPIVVVVVVVAFSARRVQLRGVEDRTVVGGNQRLESYIGAFFATSRYDQEQNRTVTQK